MYGVRGATTAGGLFVLPSFVLLCGMSASTSSTAKWRLWRASFELGAAVIALVAAAVLRVGGRVITTPAAFAVAAIAFGAIVVGVPFLAVVALAAFAGYLAGRVRPGLLAKPSRYEDDAPEPTRAETRLWRRFAKSLVIWLVPAGLLLAGGLVAELAGFFTLAALVTFGGAYAVLPFVANAAVNRFDWLSADDMVAGLASGSRRPAP